MKVVDDQEESESEPAAGEDAVEEDADAVLLANSWVVLLALMELELC